jgi:hypothetical protein
MKSLFRFPNPVNEYAARFVAFMVVVLTLLFLVTTNIWILIIILYGFVARVLTGPTLSPLGLLATKVLVPIFGNPVKSVPGPPKRFAQTIGLLFATAALITFLFSEITVTRYLIGTLGFFASLEAFIGFCTGCYVFGWMMKFKLIPESICENCAIDYSKVDSI